MTTKNKPENIEARPPYAPYSAMQGFLEIIKKISPKKIDVQLLKTHQLAGGNESSVITALRFLDLIDDEGIPTKKLTMIQKVGPEASDNLLSIVKEAYSDLLSQIDPGTVDFVTLQNYFLGIYRSPQMARKAAMFFRGIGKEAGLLPSPTLPEVKRKERSGIQQRKAIKNKQPPSTETEQQRQDLQLQKLKILEKIADKIPQFDSSWDPDTIALIFTEIHRLLDRVEGEAEIQGQSQLGSGNTK